MYSLLEQNIDSDRKNKDGNTALHLAVIEGHQVVVSILLEHEADVDAISDFLGAGLIDLASMGHLSVLKSLLERDVDVSEQDSSEETALDLAVIKGCGDIVSMLL